MCQSVYKTGRGEDRPQGKPRVDAFEMYRLSMRIQRLRRLLTVSSFTVLPIGQPRRSALFLCTITYVAAFELTAFLKAKIEVTAIPMVTPLTTYQISLSRRTLKKGLYSMATKARTHSQPVILFP